MQMVGKPAVAYRMSQKHAQRSGPLMIDGYWLSSLAKQVFMAGALAWTLDRRRGNDRWNDRNLARGNHFLENLSLVRAVRCCWNIAVGVVRSIQPF
jgi:hypothetical protein